MEIFLSWLFPFLFYTPQFVCKWFYGLFWFNLLQLHFIGIIMGPFLYVMLFWLMIHHYALQVRLYQRIYLFFCVMPNNIERWNSKGRSGYNFDQFSKKKFATSLQWHPEAIHIWLTPSIESSHFLLWHEKKMISDFKNFVGNR